MNLVKKRMQRKTSKLGQEIYKQVDKQVKFAEIERLIRESPFPSETKKLLKRTNTLEWYEQTRATIEQIQEAKIDLVKAIELLNIEADS